jgi:hypothetical protein
VKDLFLVLSTAITLVSVIPYLRAMLRHETKPNIVSWLTWTLLTGIATAAEINAHEYRTAIFTGAATLETLAVVLLGLSHGFVKYTRFDVVCQVAAVVGIILWQAFDSPTVGVIAAVTIDFIGALPTIRHSWQRPFEETWQAFGLAGLGGFFALLGVATYNVTSLTYAIYIVLVNILTSGVIVYRLGVVKHSS